MPHAARPPIVSTPHAVLAVAEGRACLGVSGPRASRERGLCVCWWCGVCVALLAHPGAIYDLRLPIYSSLRAGRRQRRVQECMGRRRQ